MFLLLGEFVWPQSSQGFIINITRTDMAEDVSYEENKQQSAVTGLSLKLTPFSFLSFASLPDAKSRDRGRA